ncbi:universal stress protein [Streptomyces sp. NPDC002643]
MVLPVVAGVDGSAESLAAAMGAPPTPLRQWGRAAREAVRRERPLRLVHAWNWHPRQEEGEREIANAAQRHLARRSLRQAEQRIRAVCPEVQLSDGSHSTDTGYRDVVLALDLSDACDEVIEFAFEAARLRHARLWAVHAWQAPGPLSLGAGDVGLVKEPQQSHEWLGFLKAVLQVWRDKYPDVEVLESVVEDRPTTALVRAATGASLLVVGHHLSERPVGPRTGPVTHAAIHHVGCPVAVVPHL